MPDEPLPEIEDFNSTFVMGEGRRPNFNCDGKNHYFYIVDKSARKPNGQRYSRNRIYGGTIDKARDSFPTLTRVWETIIHPKNFPTCGAGRSNPGAGGYSGRPEAVRLGRWPTPDSVDHGERHPGAGYQVTRPNARSRTGR